MRIRHKRVIFIAISVIIATVAIILVAAGIKYFRLQSQPVTIKVPETAVVLPKSVVLGRPVTVHAEFTAGWNSYPVEAHFFTGKGVAVAGKPEIVYDGIGWGTCKWLVRGRLQPFNTGSVKGSKLVVDFKTTAKGESDKKVSVKVPDFEVKALKVDDPNSLALASAVTVDRGNFWRNRLLIWSGVAIFVVLVVLAILWWKRGGKHDAVVVLPPWTVALSEIHDLSVNLRKGLISGEACIAKLTDIVRCYLEEQFQLQAQTQTTKEFLADLEKPGGPLRETHRMFLKDFMTAADLVKFANCPADVALIDNAIEKAGTLVNETKPVENTQNRGDRS